VTYVTAKRTFQTVGNAHGLFCAGNSVVYGIETGCGLPLAVG